MDQHHTWQAAWHEIFDEDPRGFGPTPTPLPPLDTDDRLGAALWQVDAATRRRALEVLPYGKVLADRADAWMQTKGAEIAPNAAVELLRDGLARLSQMDVEQPEPGVEIRIATHGTPEYRTISMETDAVTFGVNEEFPGIGGGEGGVDWLPVYQFLREPFYHAANSNEVANWLFWPVSDASQQVDVYEPFARLAGAAYATGWHGDGSVYLFDHRKPRRTSTLNPDDIVETVRGALQYISMYHTPDYLAHLSAAYSREESPAAKAAIGQILESSRLAALGQRPMCQDTGMVTVFATLGQSAAIAGDRTLAELVNEGTRLAYLDAGNPLRASMVADPIFDRRNTRDNTPAVTHVELGLGAGLDLMIAAKGGGSENKARYAMLSPAASVEDWVVETVETLGAGWCPPGIIGVGVGGSAEKAMFLAKRAVMDEIDMSDLLVRGPASREEEMRIRLYERINNLGIGAQGLGGLTTVVDVKLASYPTHAASLPVALMPQCAANRHIHVRLDGSGPAQIDPPNLADWPQIAGSGQQKLRKVNVDQLSRAEMADWAPGETLLLSGRILTARDAAHKRMTEMLARGEPLPLPLDGRIIYYVGPVDPVGDEAVGPAGPTTSTRMDRYTDDMLGQGLLSMIGKAERGPATVADIARHGATYLIAVGGAAVLVAKAIRSARVLAFEDLGMESIREFEVEDMPVTVAVSADGTSVHQTGPARWRRN